MRTLTIGRSPECNIHVPDDSGIISRKHAILKVKNLGRYEIIDVSKNGTFVNGMRIRPHRPVSVGRKDVISFANIRQLDWGEVPNSASGPRIGIVILLILIAIAGVVWGISAVMNDGEPRNTSPSGETTLPVSAGHGAPGASAQEKEGTGRNLPALPETTPEKKPATGKSAASGKGKKGDKKAAGDIKNVKEKSSKKAE